MLIRPKLLVCSHISSQHKCFLLNADANNLANSSKLLSYRDYNANNECIHPDFRKLNISNKSTVVLYLV